MAAEDQEVTILLADIAGSTQLYEDVGDEAALRQVVECIDRLSAIIRKEGGMLIHSKGDDVLAAFTDASAGLRAMRQILSQHETGALAIHAGLHFGDIIHARGDIYGDAVNLTARLAALAKPGEALLSKRFVTQLPEADIGSFQALDSITFKGKSDPIEIFSLLADDAAMRTEFAFAGDTGATVARKRRPATDLALVLHYDGRAHVCEESTSLSVGRSAECDVLIGRPWVSRKHATVTVGRGKVQLADQSSSGTYVSVRGGDEFFVRRETVMLLSGSGTISPAIPASDPSAEVIHFEVSHRDAEESS